jgi:RNA polymerase sigma factor for flagellar operon FliA
MTGPKPPARKAGPAAPTAPAAPKPRPPAPAIGGIRTPEAQKRLVEDHIPFVRSIARKLREQVPMVEFDDLVGFGMQGLIEAGQRFDDRHGVAFTTFAYYRVRGAMFDGLRSMGWLPRSEYARLRLEERTNAYLQNLAARQEGEGRGESAPAPPKAARGRPASAPASGEVEERVRDIAEALGGVAAVFVTLLGRHEEQQLLDERAAPHEQLERHQMAARVRRALASLPEKERRLVEQYYFHDQTLEQVGAGMGLSKSWTSRLHARAIALLRETLEADGSNPAD